MKQKIYIDTSIVGGFFDKEFKEATQQLFQRIEKEYIKYDFHVDYKSMKISK